MYLGYMSDMLYSTNRGLLEKKTLFLLKKYSYQLIKNTWAVQCKVFFYLECAEQSGREDGCSDPTTDNGNSKLFLKQIKKI